MKGRQKEMGDGGEKKEIKRGKGDLAIAFWNVAGIWNKDRDFWRGLDGGCDVFIGNVDGKGLGKVKRQVIGRKRMEISEGEEEKRGRAIGG